MSLFSIIAGLEVSPSSMQPSIKLQHSKPRAKLENLRVHFGSRHFLTKLYTNLKIT